MSTRSQAALVLLASSLFAPFAAGVPQVLVPYSKVDNVVPVLAPLVGTLLRTASGDVDGDSAMDLALLTDVGVFVAFDASVRRCVAEVGLAAGATDLALTPRLSAEAGGRIAITRPDGVFLVDRNPDPGHPDPWLIEQVLESDSSLLEAKLVRAADVDGNGRSDLLVVLADEKTVRVLLRELDGDWDGTSLAPFAMPTKVRELVALPYDEDFPSELAIQTAGSARVHELDGTFVTMARNVVGGSPAGMAVMPVPGTDRQRVAYLATATDGGYDLHLLEYPFGLESLFVDELVPRSLRAADHDDDGDFDLLVDHGESGELTLLWNDEADECSEPPHHPFACLFEENAQLTLSVGSVGAVTQTPEWRDLDNDERPDLVVPVSESLGSWRLDFRPRVPAPIPPTGSWLTEEPHPVFAAGNWGDPQVVLNVAGQLCLSIETSAWANDTRPRLQVTVWRMQNPDQNPPVPGMEPQGRFNGFYLRTSLPVVDDRYQVTLPVVQTAGSTSDSTPFRLVDNDTSLVDPLASGGTDSTIYYVEVRSVELDAQNNIDSAGRKHVIGLALNSGGPSPSGTSILHLVQYPGSWGRSIPTNAYAWGLGGGGSYKIGGLVPMPSMPTFQSGYVVNSMAEYFPPLE